MTISAGDVSLTGDAAATLLATHPNPKAEEYVGRDIIVTINNTSANPVYIGGSTVTDGTNGAGAAAANKGSTVATATIRDFRLRPGDKLYGFAHTTSVINVFVNGQA